MKINNKDLIAINKICEVLELGNILNIEYMNSHQNFVYKITTDQDIYVLKEYTKDAIPNDYSLTKRKKQISICEFLSQNGVPSIVPLKFDDKFFLHYRGTYYLIYKYFDFKILKKSELDSKKIKKLANTLAIIHKLDIKSDLPCQYKKITIDYNKFLRKYKRMDSKLYQTLYDNHFILEKLTTKCNENIKYVKENLCISHNDYKLQNILWKKDFMYLIDYDACSLANPAVSLAECAFSLSMHSNSLKKDHYKEFIHTYLKKYGPLKTDYKLALSVAMNGKLQWLEYLMNICSKNNQVRISETISMINELVTFCKYEDELLNIYSSLIK